MTYFVLLLIAFSLLFVLISAKICPKYQYAPNPEEKACVYSKTINEESITMLNPICKSNQICFIQTKQCKEPFNGPKYPGEKCKNNEECEQNYCYEGECQVANKQAFCRLNSDCYLNQYCDKGNCLALIKENMQCFTTFECEMNLICINKKCKRRHSVDKDKNFNIGDGFQFSCKKGLSPVPSKVQLYKYVCKEVKYSNKNGDIIEGELVKAEQTENGYYCYVHDGEEIINQFEVGCDDVISEEGIVYCPFISNTNEAFLKYYDFMENIPADVHTDHRFEFYKLNSYWAKEYIKIVQESTLKHVYFKGHSGFKQFVAKRYN